jgi:hypothetical protein
MKTQYALELDLDELSGFRAPKVWPWTTRVVLAGLTILGLWIWTLKVANTVSLWTAPRPLPSTTKISPLLVAKTSGPTYSFSALTPSFGSLDLSRIREFQTAEFEALILRDTPASLRERMRPYLPLALKMAEHHQVDPFWVLAVMWTESHFNPYAVSRVQARGLMQIMPTTGTYLVGRLSRTDNLSGVERYLGFGPRELPLFEPIMNIEMGTYYLRHLLDQFQGNFRLATVAYNMGPAGVRRRIRDQLPTGVRNQYLNKVRHAYQHLTRSYKVFLDSTRAPYLNTYVVSREFRLPTAQIPGPLALFPFETGAPRLTEIEIKLLERGIAHLSH